jgi:hypothetical protein
MHALMVIMPRAQFTFILAPLSITYTCTPCNYLPFLDIAYKYKLYYTTPLGIKV